MELIYQRLDNNGYIERRDIQQLYDEEEGMFLPDRFIRGTCPKCHTPDQYGDSCESCGSTYSPTDLIDPRSAVTGSKPVMKKSEHYFVRLADFEEPLKSWMDSGALQPEVLNKLQEWFTDLTASGPPGGDLEMPCSCFDLDASGVSDNKIDEADLAAFRLCVSGPSVPADPDCDNF